MTLTRKQIGIGLGLILSAVLFLNIVPISGRYKSTVNPAKVERISSDGKTIKILLNAEEMANHKAGILKIELMVAEQR